MAIVIAFFVCWAPFQFYRFMVKANRNLFGDYYWDKIWDVAGEQCNVIWQKYICNEIAAKCWNYLDFFIYLGSTINPILYDVVSSRFRAAFIHTFCSSKDHTTEEIPITTYRIARLSNVSQIYRNRLVFSYVNFL